MNHTHIYGIRVSKEDLKKARIAARQVGFLSLAEYLRQKIRELVKEVEKKQKSKIEGEEEI